MGHLKLLGGAVLQQVPGEHTWESAFSTADLLLSACCYTWAWKLIFKNLFIYVFAMNSTVSTLSLVVCLGSSGK